MLRAPLWWGGAARAPGIDAGGPFAYPLRKNLRKLLTWVAEVCTFTHMETPPPKPPQWCPRCFGVTNTTPNGVCCTCNNLKPQPEEG